MVHQGESVADLIESHLSATGKTQVALEIETGITDTHIARIRAGKLPGKWTMPPLAKALGMTTEALAALVARERQARLVLPRHAVARGGSRTVRRVSCSRSTARGGAKVRQ